MNYVTRQTWREPNRTWTDLTTRRGFREPLSDSVGNSNSDDGNANENVTWKYNFTSFALLRHYFNSLNFYRNGELYRNQIGTRSGVQLKENEKFTVVCARSPQNFEFGHFTLLFRRGRQGNVLKFKRHVQSDCFSSLTCEQEYNDFYYFWQLWCALFSFISFNLFLFILI